MFLTWCYHHVDRADKKKMAVLADSILALKISTGTNSKANFNEYG